MKTNALSILILFSVVSAFAQSEAPAMNDSLIIYALPSQACQLNCTQEEFANAINPLICHAANDFEEETGAENEPSENFRIFDVKNISFPGAVDMFFTLEPEDKTDLIGKDLVLMFQCQDGTKEDDARRYYGIFDEAITALKPDCTTLQALGSYDDLGEDFPLSTIWEGDLYTDDIDGYVDVELDLKIIDAAYWVILHINMPDDY